MEGNTMEPSVYVTSLINFLMTRSPLEYTAVTGWAMSEILGLSKNTKIKSVLGVVWKYGSAIVKAVTKAVQEIELFEQSAQGHAIIAEVKKDLPTDGTPKS
jgi:hypothetical protein